MSISSIASRTRMPDGVDPGAGFASWLRRPRPRAARGGGPRRSEARRSLRRPRPDRIASAPPAVKSLDMDGRLRPNSVVERIRPPEARAQADERADAQSGRPAFLSPSDQRSTSSERRSGKSSAVRFERRNCGMSWRRRVMARSAAGRLSSAGARRHHRKGRGVAGLAEVRLLGQRQSLAIASAGEMGRRRGGQRVVNLRVVRAEDHGSGFALDGDFRLAEPHLDPAAEDPGVGEIGIDGQRPVEERVAAVEIADERRPGRCRRRTERNGIVLARLGGAPRKPPRLGDVQVTVRHPAVGLAPREAPRREAVGSRRSRDRARSPCRTAQSPRRSPPASTA